METTDTPKGDDEPISRSLPQPECSNIESQSASSSIEQRGSSDKFPAGFRSAFRSSHSLTLPKKPTQIPPPVPSASVRPDCPSLSSAVSPTPLLMAPPKPPRANAKSMDLKRGKPSESFNAYDVEDQQQKDDQQRKSASPSQQKNIRMRHPGGWVEKTDDDGNSLYIHPESTDQWVKAVSVNGETYFYEKTSRRSAWVLPTVEPRNVAIEPASCRRPTSTIGELFSAPVTCFSPGTINTIDLSEAQAKFGARKTPVSKSGDNLSTISAQDDGSSRFYRVSKDHITGPIENKIRATERRGQVNFTKYSANGVSLPKKWIPSILVLIGPTLYVYKDSKAQQPAAASPDPAKSIGMVSPRGSAKMSDSGIKFFNFLSKGSCISGKPELESHVKHLQISPTDKTHTTREHTFVLKDFTDSDNVAEYLIEVSSAELRKAWETALQYSQDFVKEDRFDRRALSTRPPPNVDQKVVVMLREFFRKRPTLESIREAGILQNEPVFGSNLIELCQKEQTKVPTFVTRVILAVEARGLETSGLYRRSGNGAVIQKLRNQVNHSEYSLNSDEWDIYELSDSLKLFLRELKEPLLLYSLYSDFRDFSSTMGSDSVDQNVSKMRRILQKLPECHYATAKLIFEHLSKVAALESTNQMSAKNLALVFGPNIMWQDTPTDDYAHFPIVGCACTEFMITNNAAKRQQPLTHCNRLSVLVKGTWSATSPSPPLLLPFLYCVLYCLITILLHYLLMHLSGYHRFFVITRLRLYFYNDCYKKRNDVSAASCNNKPLAPSSRRKRNNL
ncbi:Rho GTPase activating protein 12 [Echinococcus multilocularis]|uniref:Rho GTPase activating protein 12 n=1 Tax=Echinococcus multilocularis TaxID=6211 RepID=A0A068YBA2_ECHMU|nr:Rho GTPase activating protein 12 [Echinococcus multilocularis]